MAVDGLLVLNDAAEAVKEFEKGNVLSGAMHFGNGFLRLFGLSQTYINRLKCFPAGTPVHTPNGPRAIETIAEGDHVWAFDFASERWESRLVTAIHRNWNTEKLVQITAAGKLIESTPSHPFWLVSGENLEERPASLHREALSPDTELPGRWVDARDLCTGDEVLLLDGRRVKIDSLGVRESAEFVYNFAVDGLHTYAVGESGILVHNTCEKISTQGNTPPWKEYEKRFESKQTPMTTTFDGKTVSVRLDKPPTDSSIIDFKDYNWGKPAYDKPFIQEMVAKNFTDQILLYRTICPKVHFQFSQEPPSWVIEAISKAGGTYSVVK